MFAFVSEAAFNVSVRAFCKILSLSFEAPTLTAVAISTLDELVEHAARLQAIKAAHINTEPYLNNFFFIIIISIPEPTKCSF